MNMRDSVVKVWRVGDAWEAECAFLSAFHLTPFANRHPAFRRQIGRPIAGSRNYPRV
jgi:hypothetical protein